jgi:hypothetical protein
MTGYLEMSLRLTQKQRFQFETATSTFLENLPFCPIDFATLEIERDTKRPRPFAGVSISLTAFFANRFHKATRVQLTCRLLTDFPTGYDLSPLERHF